MAIKKSVLDEIDGDLPISDKDRRRAIRRFTTSTLHQKGGHSRHSRRHPEDMQWSPNRQHAFEAQRRHRHILFDHLENVEFGRLLQQDLEDSVRRLGLDEWLGTLDDLIGHWPQLSFS